MAKKQSAFERKANEIARVAFLDKDGKPKSAAWLYAFMLAILFAVFYAGIFIGSGLLLGKAWPEGSAWAIILQYLMTAVLGSLLCLAFCLFMKGTRRCLIWYAYIWLAVLFVMILLTVLLLCDWAGGNGGAELWQFGILLLFPSILSILCGGIPAKILWDRELKKQYEAEEQKKSRPSYYNT